MIEEAPDGVPLAPDWVRVELLVPKASFAPEDVGEPYYFPPLVEGASSDLVATITAVTTLPAFEPLYQVWDTDAQNTVAAFPTLAAARAFLDETAAMWGSAVRLHNWRVLHCLSLQYPVERWSAPDLIALPDPH